MKCWVRCWIQSAKKAAFCYLPLYSPFQLLSTRVSGPGKNLVRFAHNLSRASRSCDWNNGTMEWWNIGTIRVPSGWKIIRFQKVIVIAVWKNTWIIMLDVKWYLPVTILFNSWMWLVSSFLKVLLGTETPGRYNRTYLKNASNAQWLRCEPP